MSQAVERSAVLVALNAVKDPRSEQGLVEAGLVQGLVARDGRVGFMLEVAPGDVELYEPVREEAEAVLRALPGVERAQVVLTADRAAGPGAQSGEPPVPPGTVRMRRNARLSTDAQAQVAPPEQRPPRGLKPAHVSHVIAVASGKGGVGKSTVAVNLAAALAMLGRRTGLLDADVYGPSVPRMTGLEDEPEVTAERKLKPLEGWGLKVMSIGLLVDEASPMIWRGPMASSALNQMLNDVAWASAEEPLDILVVDMPPGTGDIQLTLAQRVALSGAVVVSTPQEVALIDARRAVAMFEKTHIPILGVVENMAYFTDPSTGAPIEIFGRGGARAVAEKLRAPFLGEVPIEVALREACDAGRPFVTEHPGSPAAQAFLAIAEAVAAQLDQGGDLKPPPRIVFED
ncbi:MAG TPA: Mrp/NBP35 family ATP-binding protein [Caulobacteraceae bacterium]|nr:Mrp/NBP35 family ATP-binding protein [Caulobacteraceae bacterium]